MHTNGAATAGALAAIAVERARDALIRLAQRPDAPEATFSALAELGGEVTYRRVATWAQASSEPAARWAAQAPAVIWFKPGKGRITPPQPRPLPARVRIGDNDLAPELETI